MQTALDLPEIRSTIASHLHSTSPHSLLSCMLVSKTWYDSFHPFRWKTVHLHGVHSVKANVTLRRHAAHVRELSFLGVESLKHFSDIELYSRVRRMRVFGAGEEGRVVWEKLAGLVGGGGAGRLRWLSVEDSVPLPVFLVALSGGYGKRKEDRLRLSEQQQRQQEYESEDSEESEGEDESGQGRQGGGLGAGTLPATAATSTTSVNTTINSVATTLTPLSSFSSSTTTRSGGERRLDTLVWKRVRIPAANMDHLWRASRGATDLVLECLTITGMQQTGNTSTTLPTAPTLVLTEHGATYPLRPLITNPPLPSTEIQELRVSWILGLSVEWQLELWIRPCRELRSLVWEASNFPDPLLLQFVRCIEDAMRAPDDHTIAKTMFTCTDGSDSPSGQPGSGRWHSRLCDDTLGHSRLSSGSDMLAVSLTTWRGKFWRGVRFWRSFMRPFCGWMILLARKGGLIRLARDRDRRRRMAM
ncbi:hypothetical protein BGX30_015097 [Mortierella sp. GBA39]|nr:hypothetical protein BGX30_015097 [Mortierella sp. GBA39]